MGSKKTNNDVKPTQEAVDTTDKTTVSQQENIEKTTLLENAI